MIITTRTQITAKQVEAFLEIIRRNQELTLFQKQLLIFMVLQSEGFSLPLKVEAPQSMKQSVGELVYTLPRLNSPYSGTQIDLTLQAMGTDFRFMAREGKTHNGQFDRYIPGYTVWFAPYLLEGGTCFSLEKSETKEEIETIEGICPVMNLAA